MLSNAEMAKIANTLVAVIQRLPKFVDWLKQRFLEFLQTPEFADKVRNIAGASPELSPEEANQAEIARIHALTEEVAKRLREPQQAQQFLAALPPEALEVLVQPLGDRLMQSDNFIRSLTSVQREGRAQAEENKIQAIREILGEITNLAPEHLTDLARRAYQSRVLIGTSGRTIRQDQWLPTLETWFNDQVERMTQTVRGFVLANHQNKPDVANWGHTLVLKGFDPEDTDDVLAEIRGDADAMAQLAPLMKKAYQA